VKCYLDKNNNDEDEDNESLSDYENNKRDNRQDEKEMTCKDYFIIVILIILGIFLQPLYLLFYILMALVELYKQCGCWIFWVYGS